MVIMGGDGKVWKLLYGLFMSMDDFYFQIIALFLFYLRPEKIIYGHIVCWNNFSLLFIALSCNKKDFLVGVW